MSGYSTNLLSGLAALLQTAGIGTWSTSAVYTSAQTGIVLGTIPSTPDRIVALTAYPVRDDPALSDSVVGVQVRCRWGGQDPRLVDDLADLIFDYLHGKTHFTVGTGAAAVTIVQCLRQSYAPLGRDQNGRWERSDNYYVTCWRPGTNRA